jgi:fatty-acyl-CoA synthase
VTSVPDEKWGEVGLVVVVPYEGATVTLAGLQEYAARRIARFKLPRRILFLDELPRNATGKVPRALLQQRFLLGLTSPQAQAQRTEKTA